LVFKDKVIEKYELFNFQPANYTDPPPYLIKFNSSLLGRLHSMKIRL